MIETATAPHVAAVVIGADARQRFTGVEAPARLAVLVVNFNTRKYVQRCLRSLQRAPVDGGLQVVVVDNASRDGSAAAIRAEFPDVELLANEQNCGYAAANNQAFARSTAPYVFLLNPDAAVAQDAAEQMVDFLDSRPDVAAVTAKLIAEDGSPRPFICHFPTLLTFLLLGTGLGNRFPADRDRLIAPWQMESDVPHRAAPVAQPPGACLMVRRAVLDGWLFDERFPLFFNDVELCRRLHNRGGIYVLPDANVIHESGEGGCNRAPETVQLEFWLSAVRYFRKYHSRWTALALFLALGSEFARRALQPGLSRVLLRLARRMMHAGKPFRALDLERRVHRCIGGPAPHAPFSGTKRKNLARLARFLFNVSYFERRQEERSPWRRLLLRFLEADLWTG